MHHCFKYFCNWLGLFVSCLLLLWQQQKDTNRKDRQAWMAERQHLEAERQHLESTIDGQNAQLWALYNASRARIQFVLQLQI